MRIQEHDYVIDINSDDYFLMGWRSFPIESTNVSALLNVLSSREISNSTLLMEGRTIMGIMV